MTEAIDKEISQALRLKNLAGLNLIKFKNIEDIEDRLGVLTDNALQRLRDKITSYKDKGGDHIETNLQYIDNDIERRRGKVTVETPKIKREKRTPPSVTLKMSKENVEEDIPHLLSTPLQSNLPLFSQVVEGTRSLFNTPRSIIQKLTAETPEDILPEMTEEDLLEDTQNPTHILSTPVEEGELMDTSNQAVIENLEQQEQQFPQSELPFGDLDSDEINKQFKEAIKSNPLSHLESTTGMGSPILKGVREDISKLPEEKQGRATDFINKYAPILLEPYKTIKSFVRSFNKTDAKVLTENIGGTGIGKELKKIGVEADAVAKGINTGTKTNVDAIQDVFEKHGFPKKLAVALTIITIVAISTDSYLKHRRSRKSVLPSFMSAHGRRKK